MPVADTPDWSSPSGGPPAQRIGAAIGTTGTLLLGSDGTDARAILTDSSGRIKVTGAGGAPGTLVTHAAPVAYNSSNLATGHTLVFNDAWSPVVGEWVIDIWCEITTKWNGTTPLGDYYANTGFEWRGMLAASLASAPIDMTEHDIVVVNNTGFNGVQYGGSASRLGQADDIATIVEIIETSAGANPVQLTVTGPFGNGDRNVPFKFVSPVVPLKFVVTQTGLSGDASPGATQGAAVVYVTSCTPS